MSFFADFHIHSHYSRATSKELTPEMLDYWASIKGIKLLGTGDFTHPAWLAELKEKLEPAEEGLYRLKKEYKVEANGVTDLEPRFMLTAEISNIYKRDDRVRKVHSLIFSPNFEAAESLQAELELREFNISSDGRPILGLDVRELLLMVLESSNESLFVPAHIWTPWFSMLGEKSGFDSVEECFGELSQHIYALETGLSSDPPMNWLLSSLDKYTLLSNSDAHSPDKLGRNANILDSELSYPAVIEAIKSGEGFLGTVDLYPEEGKYHFDGHRKCGVCLSPTESAENGDICPECGKELTAGVARRVAELADRSDARLNRRAAPFHRTVPLKEILAEISGSSENSKDVRNSYLSLIRKGGPELEILLNMDIAEIKKISNSSIAEAIRRMREGEVYIKEGFDGEFGRIRLFAEGEEPDGEASLFAGLLEEQPPRPEKRPLINFDLDRFKELKESAEERIAAETPPKEEVELPQGLNSEQEAAAHHCEGPSLIVAGPGTGKTKTLIERICYLIEEKGVEPASILAVTFTNRAAGELRERLEGRVATGKDGVNIFTFHGLGHRILSAHMSFSIAGSEERSLLMERLGIKPKFRKRLLEGISRVKLHLKEAGDLVDGLAVRLFSTYEEQLSKEMALDLDDLIYRTVLLLKADEKLLESYRERFQWIMVDEYQDINYNQYELLRLLAPGSGANLTAIGDPDQAIYSFRGSDRAYIERFLQEFPGAGQFRLTSSYRSTGTILGAAASLLGEKPLSAQREGVPVELSSYPTERSEAEFIARTIEELLGGVSFFSMDSDVAGGHVKEGISGLSSFAVLCRTKRQMEPIKKALADHHIPCRLIGEQPFFREGVSSELIALLRYSQDRDNSLLEERLRHNGQLEQSLPYLNKIPTNLGVRECLESLALSLQIDESKSDELERLYRLAEPFGADFEEFFRYTALGFSGNDSYLSGEERVNVMTIHASKGLEFDAVFVAGCEDGLLPYRLHSGSEPDLEEERRLLYVAMTRARHYLYLSRSEKRPASPFLDSLDKSLLKTKKPKRKKKGKKENGSLFGR